MKRRIQYNINKETTKIVLPSGKIDKSKYRTGKEILASNQSKIT